MDFDDKTLLNVRELREYGFDPSDVAPSVVLHDPDDDSLTPFWAYADLDG